MFQGFIQLNREGAKELLEKDPKAYLLLSQIALRARRLNEKYGSSPLKANQAFIGDHDRAGLTQQEYRDAKKRLSRYRLAMFKSTSKGTIATLTSTDVFDINAESSTPYREQALSPMKIEKNKQAKNELGTNDQQLTRMEEFKNEIKIKQEDPNDHFSSKFKGPEDMEAWKKRMISLGWKEEECNEAWFRFLLKPPGHVQYPFAWLETVLQSVRCDKLKEGHLERLTQEELSADISIATTARLEKEKILEEKASFSQKNEDFMERISKTDACKSKYKVIPGIGVKLFDSPWNGYLLGFNDHEFTEHVEKYRNVNHKELCHE